MTNSDPAGRFTVTLIAADHLEAFRDIDRSERIEGFYRLVDGELVGDDVVHETNGWPPEKYDTYIARSREVLGRGGVAFGVLDGSRLAGFALIDPQGVASDSTLTQFDLFFVSARYRNLGLGRRLMDEVVADASSRGARGIYISATPSRNTVDRYLHFGAKVTTKPDPVLFELEPEDIHLVLMVDDYRPSRQTHPR